MILTVNPLPAAVGGTLSLCAGATRTLSDATPGGIWTSSDGSVATIGSTSAIVTGVGAGTATITYSLPTGCIRTAIVTVNAAPGSITGTPTVCVGQTTSLSNSVTGGIWTSSSAQATVGSSSGIVTGVTSGTPTITYTLGGVCFTTQVITVNALSAISGPSSACSGSTASLGDATPGGTWSSSNTTVATIGSTSGSVSALSTGTTTISYSLPSGCVATLTFTVISSPSSIGGSNRLCIGSTTTLTDAGGGAWSSSNTSIAIVGTSSGIVTGVGVGTATITYSLGSGCTVTLPITVNPLPSAITGTALVCAGATTTLADATPGGIWTTISPNASVGSSSGVVTGITSGVATISYTSALGCSVTRVVTVNTSPVAISGTLSVCVSSTTPLSDATPGGTWTSGATGVATVVSTSGLVSGIAAGTAPITYTLGSTGCFTTATVTVNPLPVAITGTLSVCVGSTTTLSDATSGGTWTAAGSSASIGSSSGIVSGLSSGTSAITYTLSTGCKRSATVTVNPLPTVASIGGSLNICTGATSTLTDATAGGTWSSSDFSIATIGSTSGAITGVALGSATITYTVTSSAGCTNAVTAVVTVNASPSPITGPSNVCVGATITDADVTSGGTWSITPTTIGTISSVGDVTGISAGGATVTYTVASGCFATYGVTVNPLPSAIGGTPRVCVSATTALTDASAGGTWTSGTITIATVGSSSGIVSGVLAGLDTITYTLPTGCSTTLPITVNPLPVSGTITGTTNVCVGSTITLADATSGGAWSSSNVSIASVGTSGVVTGAAAGLDTIRYTVTNICGSSIATFPITVNPMPDAGSITGSTLVCVGTPETLTDGAPGGSWSSGSTSVATVGSASGIVSGVAAGAVTISYTVTNVCGTANATFPVTVNTLPSAGSINGTDSVCEGDTIVLSNSTPGGSWSASNGHATVGTTGVVTGVSAGVTEVSYTVTNACGSTSTTKTILIRSHAVCNVGVRPVAPADGFNVYPNPNSGSFTVELPETTTGSLIRIVDVLGKTIETRTIATQAAQKAEFNLNVAPGSYFIDVHADDRIYRAKVTVW